LGFLDDNKRKFGEVYFLKLLLRSARAFTVLAFAIFLLFLFGTVTETFARAGGGRTSGRSSSGATRSYQKSPSQSSPAQQGGLQQGTPSAPSPLSPGRGIFSGIGGMVFGGILGAMLFRSLGFASDPEWGKQGFGFGDLFLLMILLGLIYFVFRHFRRKPALSPVAAGSGHFSEPGIGFFSLPGAEAPSAPSLTASYLPALQHISSSDPAFRESDFLNLVEDTFKQVQRSWGSRDWNGMRHLLSPEMSTLFRGDISRLVAEKRINRIENVEIRATEISAALQDRGEDLITVKMAVRLNDYTVDEQSGQVVAGDPQTPVEFTEFWTFSRNIGDKNWVLAGISQNSVQ
jgi:predicted lipid-binding transport protein (Tim44 family)